MFDIRLLRADPDAVKKAMQARRADVDIDGILSIDAQRRAVVYELEQLRARQNKTGEEIAARKRSGGADETLIEEMKTIKEEISRLEDEARAVDESLRQGLLMLPNMPDERTPAGAGASDNREERTWGSPRSFDFAPKDHVEIGEGLGILDFAAAAKLSGARFTLSRGAGSLLERALINFMLDIHTREHGYTEILPPLMVNSLSMQGTGQLPKFAEDLFKVEGTDFWLIPTAEVPVTNVHRDEILEESRLPLRYAAYTPCFRSEAGAYGKDTRGMIRVHQFNKVEMVKFTTPETSWEELESLTANAETILRRLELPYRVVSLCTGDLGFSAAKTYDIEVWLPAQNAYREISSCSNFSDFQARRANIRFRRGKKPEFVHTLNGSGIAIGRTVVAILENHQREDGSVAIPGALQPYMYGMTCIPCP